MMEGENLALFLIGLAEVPNFYSGLLPSLWTIGHFSDEQDGEAKFWIRRGEIQATCLTIAMGVAISIMSRSIWPLVGMLAMAAYLLYLYEHALQHGAAASWNEEK